METAGFPRSVWPLAHQETSHLPPHVDSDVLNRDAAPDRRRRRFSQREQPYAYTSSNWKNFGGSAAANTNDDSAAKLKETAQKEFGNRAEEFLKHYSADNPAQAELALKDFAGDRFIAFSTWKWLEAQKSTGKSAVYRYRFDSALQRPCRGERQIPVRRAIVEIIFLRDSR